jgi:hypothetical protein
MSVEQHRTHALESLTQPLPRNRPQPQLQRSTRHNSTRRHAFAIDIDSPNERILRAMIASSSNDQSGTFIASSGPVKTCPGANARIIPLSAPNDIHHTMSSTPSPVALQTQTTPNFFLTRPATSPTRRSSTTKCVVCFEPMPTSPSANKTPTKRCTHDANVCPGCLERHAVLLIVDRGFTDMVCPTSMCSEVLAYRDVYAAVKDQVALDRCVF